MSDQKEHVDLPLDSMTETEKSQVSKSYTFVAAISSLSKDPANILKYLETKGFDTTDKTDLQIHAATIDELGKDYVSEDLIENVTKFDADFHSEANQIVDMVTNNDQSALNTKYGSASTELVRTLPIDTKNLQFALGDAVGNGALKWAALAAVSPALGIGAPILGAIIVKSVISKAIFSQLAKSGALDAATKKLSEAVAKLDAPRDPSCDPEKGKPLKNIAKIALAIIGGAATLGVAGYVMDADFEYLKQGENGNFVDGAKQSIADEMQNLSKVLDSTADTPQVSKITPLDVIEPEPVEPVIQPATPSVTESKPEAAVIEDPAPSVATNPTAPEVASTATSLQSNPSVTQGIDATPTDTPQTAIDPDKFSIKTRAMPLDSGIDSIQAASVQTDNGTESFIMSSPEQGKSALESYLNNTANPTLEGLEEALVNANVEAHKISPADLDQMGNAPTYDQFNEVLNNARKGAVELDDSVSSALDQGDTSEPTIDSHQKSHDADVIHEFGKATSSYHSEIERLSNSDDPDAAIELAILEMSGEPKIEDFIVDAPAEPNATPEELGDNELESVELLAYEIQSGDSLSKIVNQGFIDNNIDFDSEVERQQAIQKVINLHFSDLDNVHDIKAGATIDVPNYANKELLSADVQGIDLSEKNRVTSDINPHSAPRTQLIDTPKSITPNPVPEPVPEPERTRGTTPTPASRSEFQELIAGKCLEPSSPNQGLLVTKDHEELASMYEGMRPTRASDIFYNEGTATIQAAKIGYTMDDFANAIIKGKIDSNELSVEDGLLPQIKQELLDDLITANPNLSVTEPINEIQLPERLKGAENAGVRTENWLDGNGHELTKKAQAPSLASMCLTSDYPEQAQLLSKYDSLPSTSESPIYYDSDDNSIKSTASEMNLDDFADAIVKGKIENGELDPRKVDLISYKDDLLLELKSENNGISTTEPIAEIKLPEKLHGADNVGVRDSKPSDKQAHSNVRFQIDNTPEPTSPEPAKKPRSRTMGM